MLRRGHEQNRDASIYVGNLDNKVDESLLYELMIQVAPVVGVTIPRDRVNQTQQGYAFVEFQSERDAIYATKILNGIQLYGNTLRINLASQRDSGGDTKSRMTDESAGGANPVPLRDVGAKLFIANLNPLADEELLKTTFEKFGKLIKLPHVARNDSGESKGYAFLTFDSFESSDRALEAMDNQFLLNSPCRISYAFKEGQKGKRHGDDAERQVAQQRLDPKHLVS